MRGAKKSTGPSLSGGVSVVIPTKNDAAGLRRCLEGVFRQTVRPYEVIVIDSGSIDGTAEVARGFEGVRVVDIDPASFNHGATRNMGAELATGEFVLYTVQDAYAADEFWIERLLAGFTADDVAGVCGAQVVPEGPNTNPVVWFRPQTCPQLQTVRFSSPEDFISLPPADKKQVCGWDDVTALYRRDILRRIRFRDAVYGEDVWFAADAYARGYALAFNPAARVFHYHAENRDIAFRRTLASSMARYGALGWMPDRLSIVPELLRTVRILAVRSEIPIPRKAFWLAYNLHVLLGMRHAIDQFLSAIRAGPEAIVDLHRRYCGLAPSPLKGNGVAVRNASFVERRRPIEKDCRC